MNILGNQSQHKAQLASTKTRKTRLQRNDSLDSLRTVKTSSDGTGDISMRRQDVFFNLDANRIAFTPSAATFTEEEFFCYWYSKEEYEKMKNSRKAHIKLFEKRLIKENQQSNLLALPENDDDDQRGICLRGMERYIPLWAEIKENRVERAWEAVFKDKETRRRKHQREKFFGWMKNKNKVASEDEILAGKIAELSFECVAEAIARGKRDAKAAEAICLEDSSLNRKSIGITKRNNATEHLLLQEIEYAV